MVKVVGRRPGSSTVRPLKPKADVSPLPPSRTPVPPAWFTPALKREFAKVVESMRVSGIEPFAVDTPIIISLVVAVATHAKAARLVETEGVLTTGRDGSLVRNPAVIVAGSAREVGRLVVIVLGPDTRVATTVACPPGQPLRVLSESVA